MALRSIAATALLSLGLCAQGVRLCERIESPMAYVVVDAGAAGIDPLTRFLSPSAGEWFDEGPAASAFGFVRGVLARATGEVEVALLGVLPAAIAGGADRTSAGRGADMPLVVVRARLSTADAERMRAVLADPQTAQPARQLHGHQTYALVGDGGDRGPGWRIEAVVVGDDLVVANNGRGLDEALDERTAANPRGLASDARYRELVEKLQAPPGALIAFADWRRFGARLASLGGMSGALFEWSGLRGADAMVAALLPATVDGADGALQSTLLLSFPAGTPINGWLDIVQPAPVRQLFDELPSGGLGGLVFAVEPARVAEVAGRAGGFGSRLSGACGDCGIDFARVARRLGHRGAVQMVLLSGAAAEVTPAFALQAQNRKAAVDIVDEIARAVGDGARGTDKSPHVEIRGVRGLERLRLGVVDDLLVFAQEADVVAALAAARRERPRTRAALEATLTRALRAFATDKGERVGGLVDIDIAPWLAAVGSRANPRSGAPTRSTGVLDVETGERATLVRLRLLSVR
jgi:hypothetical protein